MRGVFYLRYSSDKQTKGFSIEEQRAACKQLAKTENVEIVEIFIDPAQSAKTINRPELARLINFVTNKKNAIDVVYIYDISRLSRDSYDFATLKREFSKYGVSIHSVLGISNDTIEGDLAQDLVARVAQYKNELDSIKIRGGMYARFKEGYALHVAKGYKWSINELGKKIIIPDWTFEYYQSLWYKIRDEKLSIIQAVKYFNKLHPKLKLTQSSLSRMLENKLYCGILSYPKYPEEIAGKHTPMIDEDTYWKVREIITGRSHKNVKTRNKVNPNYPLTKTLLCPHCGNKLTAAKSRGKTKHYDYYFCRNRTRCKYNIQVKDVHEAFTNLLESIIPTEEMLLFVREMIQEKYEAYYNDLSLSSCDVEKELKVLETKRAVLLDKLLEGVINDEDFKSSKQVIESEIMAKKILVNEKKLEKVDIETILNFVEFYMQNIHKIWERSSIEVKLALQSSTFPQGVYYEEKVCRTPEISLAFRCLDSNIALGDPNDTYVELLQAYSEIYNQFGYLQHNARTLP